MSLFFRVFLIASLTLTACAKKLTETDMVKVKRVRTNDLLESMDSLSKVRPTFFYSKISTKYRDTTSSYSFKTSLRMNVDTAMNLIITYLSIPVVNALVTPDSLTVVNKKAKCVARADMEYIKENFGVDFSFRNIEELFLGIPLDYDTTQKYFQIHEPYQYVISSHRKRQMRRVNILEKQENDVAIKYFLTNDTKQLKGMEILSPSDTASIYIDYLSRQNVGGMNVPQEVVIKVITARNNLLITLSYDRVEVNEPQPLYFIVPEGYEDCE
jgi:hypothetical protein|tara:strand:+ start:24145 stop:24954 length:810 start_codon:yes stop_codon:yes gene_type:complete